MRFSRARASSASGSDTWWMKPRLDSTLRKSDLKVVIRLARPTRDVLFSGRVVYQVRQADSNRAGGHGLRAIGLMSGTSLDGVDVALIETDGERIDGASGRARPTRMRPTSGTLLRRALDAAPCASGDRTARPGVLAAAERMVTAPHRGGGRGASSPPTHRTRVRRYRRASTARPCCTGRSAASPCRSATAARWRALPASRSPMISAPPMWRPAGRGRRWCRCSTAPLRRPSAGRGRCWCSISAASPTSPISATDGDPIACDTGPGNALIDDFMRARSGEALTMAAPRRRGGTVDRRLLERVLWPTRSLRRRRRNRSTAMLSRSAQAPPSTFRWPTARRRWRH